jgi:uncharacterized membrane protein
MRKRPLSVTAIGYLYIVIGVIALVSQLAMLRPHGTFQYDILWASLVELIALVSGVYILRASNWARWLALAWIIFHVVLSAFHAPLELTIHSLLCLVIAYCLFRPPANDYFRRPSPPSLP